jgi:hypothetical protein
MWVCSLSRRGPRSHCWYPAVRVPPHTSFRPRQGEGCASAHCHVPTTPDPASLLRWAPAQPCAPRLRTSPPCSGGLRYCHMSHSSGPRLPDQEGSGAATCRTAPDSASLLRRASMLPRAPQLWTPPLCSGGLRSCHVSHGSGPRLSAREGSGAATWSTAPDPTSLLRGAPTLSRVPRHSKGRMPKNKERLSCNGMQQGSRVFKTRSRVTEAPETRAGRQHYHDLQTM